ncbi:MAG: nucleotidyl cyclase domain-containing protein [Planctomycetota bacterium]|jgi:hypothetical protein
MRERHRCERYNCFFCLVVLASAKLSAVEIVNRINSIVRASDMLGLVDEEGRYHCCGLAQEPQNASQQPQGKMVGIILPQTDRRGGWQALQRLSSMLPRHDQVRMGLAVYPDDSTSPDELVIIAAASGLGAGATLGLEWQRA